MGSGAPNRSKGRATLKAGLKSTQKVIVPIVSTAGKYIEIGCGSKVILSGVNSHVIMSGYGDHNPDHERAAASRSH